MIITWNSQRRIYLSSTGASWDLVKEGIIGEHILNKWVHRAVVRNGNLILSFQNGKKTNEFSIGDKSIYNNGTNKSMLYNAVFDVCSPQRIENLRISNVARYTENFTPPTQPYNSITINKTNQTDANIEFNIEKLGQETINKVEVLVNGTVSETYSDNYDSVNYLIDNELLCIGNNDITIRVTYDDTYTEEKVLTHKVIVDELPTETPLLDTVERVKLLTKSKQNEKDMLSNILTSKNVEVLEEDKMSDLIGKVDLLDKYDNGKLWLYKDGDECTDVTGGWVEGYYVGNKPNISKLNYLSFVGSSSSGLINIVNNIDLSTYRKLKINLDIKKATKGSFYMDLTSDKSNSFDSSILAYTSNVEYVGDNITIELDISNINKNVYIRVGGVGSLGCLVEINIHKIWLEK